MRAWIAWALVVTAAVAAVVLLLLGTPRPPHDDLFGGAGGIAFAVLGITSATVGVRGRGNAVARVFFVIGGLIGFSLLTYAYATYGGLPGTRVAAVVWNPFSEPEAPLLALALLLFPDGRLPSPRWRAVAAIALASAALMFVSRLFADGALEPPLDDLANPVGIPGSRGVLAAADLLAWMLTTAAMALAAAATVIRLRRAHGEERQQLKLILLVGGAAAAITVTLMLSWFVWDADFQWRIAAIGAAFSAFTAAAGAAILRYRLYDVDTAVDRTLVYTALTLLLAAAYALTALVLGRALGDGSTWATAGATLVVAAAFGPLRAFLQDTVDRRFRRARYDALQRLASFLEDLRAGLAQPEAIEPLLRELLGDRELELWFFLPESEVYVDSGGLPVRDLASDPRVRTPVERAGAPVALVLHRPTGPERPDPLATLVEAGGLAIEIARLRVELRRQLAEVEASRARIVAAGNAERRRIERDLHDGAQQRLVSIGLQLRLIQRELGPGGEALDPPVQELRNAIAELRQLAQGLPPSQLDSGLAPALRELAGRAPLPVEVRTTAERFTFGIEAAAYFVACEGLTNAIKHARASSVVVSALRHNGSLVVSVADDGIGGAVDGSGLSGLRDRVAAHGGCLRIESPLEAGTTLTAELPCAS